MGKCKYCGQSAGFFSRSHKECEEKHSRGIEGMTHLMRRYFNGTVSAVDLGAKISRNKTSYFLTEDDIVASVDTAIGEFTDTLRRPFNSDTLPKIKGFITNIGLPYATLNKNGSLDRLSLKLFQGYVVDYFAKGVPLSQISISTDSVTSVLPLSQQKRDEGYVSKDLQRGILPQKPLTVPVMLSRDEAPLWIYDNVTMLQEKITREYVGGSRGMSYRICKGLTYRTGSFKGHPVERSFMDTIGVGQLVITNKNLFFHCPTASVKIPYKKLVGVTPYADGLEVHKEEAKPKRTVFQGFDAWFVMNVLNQVNI